MHQKRSEFTSISSSLDLCHVSMETQHGHVITMSRSQTGKQTSLYIPFPIKKSFEFNVGSEQNSAGKSGEQGFYQEILIIAANVLLISHCCTASTCDGCWFVKLEQWGHFVRQYFSYNVGKIKKNTTRSFTISWKIKRRRDKKKAAISSKILVLNSGCIFRQNQFCYAYSMGSIQWITVYSQ